MPASVLHTVRNIKMALSDILEMFVGLAHCMVCWGYSGDGGTVKIPEQPE